MDHITQLAYCRVADNLRKLPVRTFHDPFCFCQDPKECLNFTKGIEPTEASMYPLRVLKQVVEDDFKKELKNELNASKKSSKKETYIFVTINPKPDIDFQTFYKKIQKTLKSELFAEHLAVIEQRGNCPKTCGQGLHAHILFKRITPLNEGLPPTNIKRNLRQSYKKICLSSNNQIFNIQFITEEFAADKINYILGEKTGTGKKEKQNYDKIFRVQQKIPEYLGNSNILKSPKIAEN